jgi:hypothetical protein
MLPVKCPLHFLVTSGGNMMTHAYWCECNTVMWHKKYQSDITALWTILWNSWVANNFTVFTSVCLQTGLPGFSSWHRERTYPVAPVSTPALNPTQPPNQNASGVNAAGGVTLTTLPRLVPRSWMKPFHLVVCVAVSGDLYFSFAKSNKVCVSVVNNNVCVVVMLQIQVMYITFR